MKYIRQFGVVLLFSLLGELCHWLIPLPIPASIYGMVLLFAALALKILPKSWVQETGGFLVSILPLLFVVPVVGLLGCLDVVAENWAAILVILLVSTCLTFTVSGLVTQALLKKRKEDTKND